MFHLAGTPFEEKGYFINFVGVGQGQPADHGNVIGFSQDGFHFHVEDDTPWIGHGSDTGNPVLYNPRTKQYMIFCRPDCLDRRVAQLVTTDFKTFGPPTVVLQPDAEDPPCREFYGVGPVLYEDLFVATLCIYDTEPTEKSYIKWQGTDEIQLAYSYNGQNWYRASRETFIGRGPAGSNFGGCVYAGLARVLPDRLLFSGMAGWSEHGCDFTYCSEEWKKELLFRSYLYELRLDGFMYLRTRARQGMLRTKAFVPQGGELTINARTTPSGYVKAVILDAGSKPIPGYTLDDAIPLTGDELFGKLHWRQHQNMDELKDKSVMLELHVREAELYALRFAYRPHLGEHVCDRL
jgi:hypothetical protein